MSEWTRSDDIVMTIGWLANSGWGLWIGYQWGKLNTGRNSGTGTRKRPAVNKLLAPSAGGGPGITRASADSKGEKHV
jgi:hypothetical protein